MPQNQVESLQCACTESYTDDALALLYVCTVFSRNSFGQKFRKIRFEFRKPDSLVTVFFSDFGNTEVSAGIVWREIPHPDISECFLQVELLVVVPSHVTVQRGL